MNKIVGIDLGTTNSLVAVVEDGRPRVLERDGQRLIPSVVGRADSGEIIVGQEALNQYVLAPERTVRSIKRRMGTTEQIKLGDTTYSPEEISAFILRHLKQMAEDILGEKVDRAVITVPAYFNDAQRQATTRAGEMAGLEVVRIINEPTAAALAYGVDQQMDQFLLVYDLGGGTFDVSIIEQHGEIMEVRASHGNVHLGGDDFDERVLQHLLAHLSGEHRYEFKEDRRAMARLVRAAERAKTKLSDSPYAKVIEEFLASYDSQAAHLNTEIEREEFEGMIEDLLGSTIESVHKALEDSGLAAEQITRVLLVGGSTRIPRVWELIKNELGIEPSSEINPDEAVALGAAVQAAIINGDDVQAMLIDVSPHSLGVEVASIIMGELVPGFYRPIIRRNTTIPTTKSERFFTISPEQDTVEVNAYQGESQVCVDNTLLGQFKLSGIPPSENPELPREVIVEFSYNLNGVVEVAARDRRGERHEMMTVNAATGKRAASYVETQHHFDLALEQEIARTLEEATTLELKLKTDDNSEDAELLREARHTLEEAHQQGDENQARQAVAAIEDLIYDLG
ncbi:MAG: Hsp70 family protein [Pyrinomonadaceae bacterium]|nr:Hsp70 family protein [Pyrinomonadaceae bacterium]